MGERKRFAIPVVPRGTISAHAGKAVNWVVLEAGKGEETTILWQIKLHKGASLHDWHHADEGAVGEESKASHPLHVADVIIAASGGEGLRAHLAQKGVELALTSEPYPLEAIDAYLDGRLPPPDENAASCGCGHDHGDEEDDEDEEGGCCCGHDHDHDHDHGHHGHGGCGCGGH